MVGAQNPKHSKNSNFFENSPILLNFFLIIIIHRVEHFENKSGVWGSFFSRVLVHRGVQMLALGRNRGNYARRFAPRVI